MKRWTLFDVVSPILIGFGIIVLMLWIIIVRLIDLAFDVGDYLAGRNKSCDKGSAERRPRRAF